MTLTDWQSQSSCQMSVGNDQYLIRLRKMMPTVGCEADAVVYTEDLLPIKISSFDVATGSFVGVSGSLSLPSSPSFDLHFCFGNATSKSRVRLIATFFPSDACSPPHLQNLSVVSETWVGPKGCNEELLGCGGGSPPFSQEPPSPFTPFDTTKLLSGPLSGTLSICLPLSLTVQIASKSSTEGRLQSLAVQVKKGNHGKGIIATATLCESGLTTELLEV